MTANLPEETNMAANAEQNARVLDQFTKQAASYAELAQRMKNPQLPAMLDAIKPVPADRMLDVGCGTGRSAITLAPLVAHVIGVDLTEAMLAQARRAQAAAQVSNMEWRQADVTALPFADGEFTLVTCSAMLHHVAEPIQVLSEMSRVCAAGGRIMAIDVNPRREKVPAFDAIEILRDPSHSHALTCAEVRDIGGQLGLQEIAVNEYATRFPLAAVLNTSFPEPGMLDRLRRLFRMDAERGGDAFGLGTQLENGELMVAYPMSMVVWKKH
jgi:ubiquinone/menaquinone biosynthesis C-methylase UbiE